MSRWLLMSRAAAYVQGGCPCPGPLLRSRAACFRGTASACAVLQAYLAGLTFALAASPCSTPVLATLLAYVATADNPALGGALLFTYCLGYVGPLLTAAAFTGALSRCVHLY